MKMSGEKPGELPASWSPGSARRAFARVGHLKQSRPPACTMHHQSDRSRRSTTKSQKTPCQCRCSKITVLFVSIKQQTTGRQSKVFSCPCVSQSSQQQKLKFQDQDFSRLQDNFGTFYSLKNLNTYKITTRYLAQISHEHQKSSHSLQYY